MCFKNGGMGSLFLTQPDLSHLIYRSLVCFLVGLGGWEGRVYSGFYGMSIQKYDDTVVLYDEFYTRNKIEAI